MSETFCHEQKDDPLAASMALDAMTYEASRQTKRADAAEGRCNDISHELHQAKLAIRWLLHAHGIQGVLFSHNPSWEEAVEKAMKVIRPDAAAGDLTRTAFANEPAGEAPTIPGTLFAGGFYGGRIVIDDKTYALVVAPKAEGQKILPWKNEWTSTPGTQSLNDGFANSEAMNNSEHPAAQFCRSLTIAGFTDWYLPSRDELEVLYRNLKPTSHRNYTSESRLEDWGAEPGEYNGVDEHGNGHNASSAPVGEAYSDDAPGQTVATSFGEGGAEAFDARWYLSSTEFYPDFAWGQDFALGYQDGDGKGYGFRCRAVRKVLI